MASRRFRVPSVPTCRVKEFERKIKIDEIKCPSTKSSYFCFSLTLLRKRGPLVRPAPPFGRRRCDAASGASAAAPPASPKPRTGPGSGPGAGLTHHEASSPEGKRRGYRSDIWISHYITFSVRIMNSNFGRLFISGFMEQIEIRTKGQWPQLLKTLN